jgi:hypothetical protein
MNGKQIGRKFGARGQHRVFEPQASPSISNYFDIDGEAC